MWLRADRKTAPKRVLASESRGPFGPWRPAGCRVVSFYQIAPVRTTGGGRIETANPVDKSLISRNIFTETVASLKAPRMRAPPLAAGPRTGSPGPALKAALRAAQSLSLLAALAPVTLAVPVAVAKLLGMDLGAARRAVLGADTARPRASRGTKA